MCLCIGIKQHAIALTGDLHGLGFVASGQVRGYLTVTNSVGSIILRMLGPIQGPGSLPPTLAFKVVGGTGQYALAYGKGEVLVSASDATHKFLFRFNQAG